METIPAQRASEKRLKDYAVARLVYHPLQEMMDLFEYSPVQKRIEILVPSAIESLYVT